MHKKCSIVLKITSKYKKENKGNKPGEELFKSFYGCRGPRESPVKFYHHVYNALILKGICVIEIFYL